MLQQGTRKSRSTLDTLRRQRTELLFLLPVALVVGLFIAFPLFNVAKRSLTDNATGAFTLQYYRNIFTSPQYATALRNSVVFTSVCTLVAAVGGTFVGLGISRLTPRLKGPLLSIFSLPLTLSGLVVAFAFIVLLGRNGVLNLIASRILGIPSSALFDLYSWGGLLLVYSFFNIPLMTMSMAAVFEQLDRSLIEAARNLGARPTQVWRHVIIPVLAPGFVAGVSIVFAGMMGAFGTALALTGMAKNLLSLQIFSHVSESIYDIPQADALAVVLALVAGFSLWLFGRVERRWMPGEGRS